MPPQKRSFVAALRDLLHDKTPKRLFFVSPSVEPAPWESNPWESTLNSLFYESQRQSLIPFFREFTCNVLITGV